MKNGLKLLLAFAPWLAFLVIAHGTMLRLEIGLVVGLALSVVMGLARLNRGVILWAGLAFFAYATVAVFYFESMWTVRHMGVLASGALAVGSWLTLVMKKPFTLEYAKEHVDPALWQNPVFIRTNVILTSLWATVFSANALLAWGEMNRLVFSNLLYEIIPNCLLVGMVVFNSWYPNHVKRAHATK